MKVLQCKTGGGFVGGGGGEGGEGTLGRYAVNLGVNCQSLINHSKTQQQLHKK